MALSTEISLLDVHERLTARHDVSVWHWNAQTPALEVCVGCILVQHTSWANVEKALTNLRAAGALSFEALDALSEEVLAALVRPSGTQVTKARRLKAFLTLAREAGGLEALLSLPVDELRPRLLATYGIGPETADAILLYAAGAPVVVHDAYTARLMRRIGLGPEKHNYAAWQAWLDERLPAARAFRWANHAAIVLHCKETCRVRPKCGACPLLDLCQFGQAQTAG
jgi:endonuclease-3 related protein